jgi:hypothetical protein
MLSLLFGEGDELLLLRVVVVGGVKALDEDEFKKRLKILELSFTLFDELLVVDDDDDETLAALLAAACMGDDTDEAILRLLYLSSLTHSLS